MPNDLLKRNQTDLIIDATNTLEIDAKLKTAMRTAVSQCQQQANIISELVTACSALLEYIDAIPEEVNLPVMPGLDRDWLDNLLDNAKRVINHE